MYAIDDVSGDNAMEIEQTNNRNEVRFRKLSDEEVEEIKTREVSDPDDPDYDPESKESDKSLGTFTVSVSSRTFSTNRILYNYQFFEIHSTEWILDQSETHIVNLNPRSLYLFATYNQNYQRWECRVVVNFKKEYDIWTTSNAISGGRQVRYKYWELDQNQSYYENQYVKFQSVSIVAPKVYGVLDLYISNRNQSNENLYSTQPFIPYRVPGLDESFDH